MEIELRDKVPASEPYRRVPRQLHGGVKNYIDDVITNGWVRTSYLDYTSPMVCARRKGSSLRLCIDYREPNFKTIPDKKPRTEDNLDNLWCAVLVYYTRYVKNFSSGLHPQKSEQVHCFFNTLVALKMAKNTIWINKCPILFSKVHK